jgi:hypothetical protein
MRYKHTAIPPPPPPPPVGVWGILFSPILSWQTRKAHLFNSTLFLGFAITNHNLMVSAGENVLPEIGRLEA